MGIADHAKKAEHFVESYKLKLQSAQKYRKEKKNAKQKVKTFRKKRYNA